MNQEQLDQQSRIMLEPEVTPVINYALHQNGAKLVRSITLNNPTQEELRDLQLRIEASPGFAMPTVKYIDLVAPKTRFSLSDSEVLLHGYEQWGAALLDRLRGMYAFVIWDREQKRLFGARDMFGIKPFYYAKMNDCFLFGSEIKSFVEHPKFDKVFNGYNEIQKRQGLDLSKYKGKTVTRYTYEVTNYENENGKVYANVIVYRNKVIGGDICSANVGGFIHGFSKQSGEK